MNEEGNKTIIFDLETLHTFDELKLFKKQDKDPSKLRMALGGILYEEDGNEAYKFFEEHQAHQLIETLNNANLIIGHNILQFDYRVLQQYHKDNITKMLYDKSFDTMLKLIPFTDGCWCSLDDLAQLNLGMCKPHSGAKIPAMWRDGFHKEVEEYLRNDLKMTKNFYNFTKEKKRIKYTHKEFGRVIGEREIDVKW